MCILTAAIEVESGLGSVDSNGDGPLLSHGVLEILFTVPRDVNIAGERGANIFRVEATRAILRTVKKVTYEVIFPQKKNIHRFHGQHEESPRALFHIIKITLAS